jgi:HAD superfamily hydrolase (TIGR01509 family)
VLFDWGDTLFESPHAPSVILTAAHDQGLTLQPESATKIWNDLWDAGKTEAEHAKGRDLSREAHRRVWIDLFSRANATIPGIDRLLYDKVMDPAGWVPYPDTERTLRALRDRGVKIGVVSNTAHDLRPFFAARGLADLIDSYTLSYEVGVQKPERGIFDAATRTLGTSPGETLMVGDDPVSDGGAGAAGLALYILPPHAEPGTARGLDRVVELVDRSRR